MISIPERTMRTPEILEAHHRPVDALDGAVILLDPVIQVLVLPDLNARLPLGADGFQRGRVDATFIDGDYLWLAIPVDRLLKIAPRGHPVATGAQKKVHDVAIAVHRAVQIIRCRLPIAPTASPRDSTGR